MGLYYHAEESVTLEHGNGPEQDNGLRSGEKGADAALGVAYDPTRGLEVNRDRSDIRVYEEGLGASHNEHSEYSERDRREAESERLVSIARPKGQYLDSKVVLTFGKRYPKVTGESEDIITTEGKKVFKIKNPYAKSQMKGNMQPEDAIYNIKITKGMSAKRSQEGADCEKLEVRVEICENLLSLRNGREFAIFA